MKIYTRKGDRGQTSLFSGRRAPKSDPRVAAVGDLDELSASLGLARLANPDMDEELRAIQQALYAISAVVSAEDKRPGLVFDIGEAEKLEVIIDRVSDGLPPLRDFIFPGQSEASSRLHMARAIARRAERNIAVLVDPEPSQPVLAYVNRLSDLLFVLARQADQRDGQSDMPFKPKG